MKKILPYSFCLIIAFVTNGIAADESRETVAPSSQSIARMRFKLGFEFQEMSGLCPWALDNFHVQKEILFGLFNYSLNVFDWHVVIDTGDIEFVTRPFSDGERKELESCLQSVSSSFESLKNLLESNKEVTLDQ